MAIITMEEREYLLEGMKGLLEEYDYKYTEDALNQIIDKWSGQKGDLLEAFKKHPNYIEGKFMIAFDTDYDRGINRRASQDFGDWLRWTAIPERKGLFPKEIQDKTNPGDLVPWDLWDFFVCLGSYAERCVSENTANLLNNICPAVHAHAGQKTSRVVNKLCCYLGLDKVYGYNREFAKYADSLSPLTIKRHTVLSISPLDYLTMSFGNSWASCHTIDKANKRGIPNNYSGCYSSGTISYMLDETSMVLYTVDASYNGNEYWTQPKINRQMFHYGEEKLVQGRLYPQDNDAYGDVYTPYRNIVQNIISTIFNFPNLWTLSKGTDNASRYVSSYGTHYRDYEYYDNCSLSCVKGSDNHRYIRVGSSPICVHCGDVHSNADNICCCGRIVCENCGCIIDDEEDVVWIDGEPYCRDCCHYCDRCNEYHRGSEYYVRNYGWVCESCLNEDFVYCDRCGAYVRDEYSTWIESEEVHVCDDCRIRYYSCCEDCGEYVRDEDTYFHHGDCLCESCYDARMENEENNEVC